MSVFPPGEWSLGMEVVLGAGGAPVERDAIKASLIACIIGFAALCASEDRRAFDAHASSKEKAPTRRQGPVSSED